MLRCCFLINLCSFETFTKIIWHQLQNYKNPLLKAPDHVGGGASGLPSLFVICKPYLCTNPFNLTSNPSIGAFQQKNLTSSPEANSLYNRWLNQESPNNVIFVGKKWSKLIEYIVKKVMNDQYYFWKHRSYYALLFSSNIFFSHYSYYKIEVV